MTAPLTAPDCDLRDFPFMPLDVVRLRDSDLVALESAEAFRAAVLLWSASWHQIPAASLPDDDRVLSNLAGYGRVVKEWTKVRQGALRGWIRCDDARLYHPVIAEKANEAWKRKLDQAWKTECARIKKHNQRHAAALPYPSFEEFLSRRTGASCPEGQPRYFPRDIAGDITSDIEGDSDDSPGYVPGETPSNRQGDGQGHGADTSTSRSAREAFRMHVGWQPSAHLPDMARQAMVTLTPEVHQEFIAYWLGQPAARTQAEWDKALLQSAIFHKTKAASQPAAAGQTAGKQHRKSPRGTIHEERANTIAELTGRSANGRDPIDITPE